MFVYVCVKPHMQFCLNVHVAASCAILPGGAREIALAQFYLKRRVFAYLVLPCYGLCTVRLVHSCKQAGV